jgi:hypothetical protein
MKLRTWCNSAPVAASLAFLALPLAGCGGGGEAVQVVAPEPVGMLRLVRNAAELESSLKAGVRAAPTVDALAAATASPGQFSGTYTQEVRVDELDAVRYDGVHLYIAPQRHMSCCFVADPLASVAPPPLPAPRAIRILKTDPVNATATQVGSIALESGVSVQGLYVTGDRAVALTSEAYFGSFGRFWTGLPFWAPAHFGLRIYDVANPAAPRTLFVATMDGVFVESRRIGDRVYVVSRHTPRLLLDAAQRAAVDATPLASLLPQITFDGVTRPLVDPARCYVTTDDSDGPAAVITSITVIPVLNPAAWTTTCYNEEAYGVYVAEQSLYLTQYRLAPSPQPQGAATTKTRIHKFDIAGTAPVYRGSAEVDGAAWSGGQSDFRLSEFNGQLRIMTTEFSGDIADNQDHRLFVLRQRSNAPELEIVAQLPNSRRPEEIGKPNEALYGVRFLGNRAYAVTFERIDPLYVIDLSDSSDPRIAGSLELPGFSDFLHVVSDGVLLGLGQAATGGVRLALFDVSTLGRPRELGGITLGGRGSSSEAQYDRHAFTYLADAPGGDRFAIPVNLFSEDGRFRFQESALNLFEIRNKGTPNLATLHGVGKLIATGSGQPQATPIGRSRSFIHDNTVFHVADDEVRAAKWNAPSPVNGPF